MNNRPSWDQYFLKITDVVAERATCVKRKVGAVIVKDNRILSSGYNGAPKGFRHCKIAGCLRKKMKVPSGQRHELCRGLHAEQNAIIQASVYGVSIRDSVMYCTHQPCAICVKMIINAGIKRLVYTGGYPDQLALDLVDESGLELENYKESIQ